MDLTGKNFFITGSSKGIGRGCAIECAKAGANVAINYRSEDGTAQQVADEVRAMGRKALLLQGDVAEQATIEKLIAQAAEQFGQLDGFVSNAVYSDRERMVDANMEGFKRTIDVSMWGAFYGVRTAAQTMVKQGKGGVITVISSPHAVLAIPTSMAYNMAKAAIDHMARTAAVELADDRIRVNAVHPGWIDTPGERKFFDEGELAEGAKSIPWKRLGKPEEIGKLVAFMMSDDCDYMTGSTVLMDGGICLPWWSNRADGQP